MNVRVLFLLGLLALGLAVALFVGACSGRPALAPVEGEAQLFARSWLLPVYPKDGPLAAEVGVPLRLAATPGEYEPASLGVRANVALTGARVVISDLAGPGGAVLPATAFEVRVTRYMEPPPDGPYARWRRHAPKDQPRLPSFLEPRDTADAIPAGAAQQFWLTLRVPDDAPPGPYRGAATLTAAGLSAPLALPVEVEVYPFRLAEARADLFAPGDNWPVSAASFAESRAHGMNTIVVNPGHPKVAGVHEDGRWSFPGMVENVGAVVDAAREAGLARGSRAAGVMMYQHLVRSAPAGLKAAGVRKPPGAGEDGAFDEMREYWLFAGREESVEGVGRFRGAYHPAPNPFAVSDEPYARALFEGWVAAFRQLDAGAAARGWPKPWYWLTDEPHVHRGRFRAALVMARAAREAGADALVTCNAPTVDGPEDDEPWFPPVGAEGPLRFGPDLLAIRSYYNLYLGPETLERTRAAKARYGTYVNVYANQPAAVRLQSGYLAWRLSLDSIMFWAFEPVGATPSAADGPRATLRDWEAAREGIDDLRYLEALSAAIRAGQGGADARRAAQAVLDEITAAIPTNVKEAGFVDSYTGRYLRGWKPWPTERYDGLRRRAAEALTTLVRTP